MRSAVRDGRASPVENLMRNPRFRRCRPGTSLVRRNLAIDPQGGRTGVGFGFSERWAGNGGTQTVGTVTGAADGPVPGVTRYARKTWTGIGQAQDISFAVCRGRVLLTPGRTYTFSVYWRASWNTFSSGAHFQNNIRVVQYEVASGTGPLGSVTVQSAHLPAPAPGEWQRQSITITATAERPYVDVFHSLYASLPSIGSTLDATALLVEERPALLPYFDAATDALFPGFTLAWEGTAFGSASQMRAQVTTVRTNLAGQPISDRATSVAGYGVANGATIAFVSGAEGFRVTAPAGGIKDSGAALTGGINNALVYAGRTYTYSIDVTGEVADSWRLSAQGAWASGAVMTSSGVTAIGVGETKRLWLTITPTANGVSAIFLLRNDASIASQARFRRVLFEETTLVLPYFDGDTTPDADLAPAWLGTAGSSQSTLSGVVPAGAIGNQGNRLAYLSLQYPGEWVVPTYAANNDSFGQWNTDGIPDIALVRGKRITMVGTLRMTTPQTGLVSGLARMFAVQVKIGNDFVTVSRAAGSAPPNVAGIHQVRMSFDVPADATAWGFLRAFNGDQPSGATVYWSNVAMVIGKYDGPAIDGDMPGCAWRGTPHDSPTVGYLLAA